MKLDEIRKLVDEASTPGPWEFDSYSCVFWDDGEEYRRICQVPVCGGDTATPEGAKDARFIAAARTLVPLLWHIAFIASLPPLLWDECSEGEAKVRDSTRAALKEALKALEDAKL